MPMMVEWPGRCEHCRLPIEDWPGAGLHGAKWLHKNCFQEMTRASLERGVELQPLRAPDERAKMLDWPMLGFLMLFHFGLGAAVAGWLMMQQNWASDSLAASLLIIGIVIPLIGVAGCVVNVISRRRIELVRQALEMQGGWKPGR